MSVESEPSGYHLSPHSHLANIHRRKNFIFFGGFCNTSNYGEAHTFHIGVLLWACVLKKNRKHRRVFGQIGNFIACLEFYSRKNARCCREMLALQFKLYFI